MTADEPVIVFLGFGVAPQVKQRRLGKRPAQVRIANASPGGSIGFARRWFLPFDQPRVGAKLPAAREPPDIVNFVEHRQDQHSAHPFNGFQQMEAYRVMPIGPGPGSAGQVG